MEKKELKIEKLKIEELKKEIEDSEKLRDGYLAGWQRAQADLLNYKKEETERISGIIQYAYVELVFKILPILDNFHLAQEKLTKKIKNNEEVKGLFLIINQLRNFLKSIGLEEIICLGEKFDTNFHEAIEEVDKKDFSSIVELATEQEEESGIVVEEIQKGYKFNGKVLRPAKVKVTK